MARSLYLRFRRGTAAAWAAANSVLGAGEPSYETDTGLVKVGDGATAYSALGGLASQAYAGSQAGLRTRYQGAWSSTSSYAVNDLVTYNGGLYICTTGYSPGAAASYVGSGKIYSTTAAGANLPLPAGAAAGDLLVLALATNGGGGAVEASGVSTLVTAVSGNGNYLAGYKVLSGTDISNGYLAIPAQGAQTNWAAVAEVLRNVTGVDSTAAQSTNNQTPVVTPTSYPAYVMQICWNLHDTTADGTMTQASVSGLVTQGTPAGVFGAAAGAGYDLLAGGSSTARIFGTAGNGGVPCSAAIPLLTAGFDITKFSFLGNADTNLPPTGSIMAFAGTVAPTGYLLCNGTSYTRTAYPALFGVIGTTFGAADATHFTVPDLRARVPFGKAASGTFATLGATGGATTHTHALTTAYAKITAAGSNFALLRIVTAAWSATVQGPSETVSTSTFSETSAAGLGGSTDTGDHTPPYQVVNYIIKT